MKSLLEGSTLAKLRFPFTLIPALKKMPASDIRDWTAATPGPLV